VRFSYQKSGTTRRRLMTLDALEFIRRFLQHVLPTGFMKVRYYGFLSPTAKTPLETVIAKVELALGLHPECARGGAGALAHTRLCGLWRPTALLPFLAGAIHASCRRPCATFTVQCPAMSP